MNTSADLRAWCAERDACEDALDWLDTLPADTPLRDVYEQCERGDWLLWGLARAGVDITPALPAVFAAADRAVRQHLPSALRAVGFRSEAARLETLPEIVDRATAWAAADAADAVWAIAAGRGAGAAGRTVAWAAKAATGAAAWAVEAAAWAAVATRAVANAADADAAAEHRRCAEHIRVLITWEQAVEQMKEGK